MREPGGGGAPERPDIEFKAEIGREQRDDNVGGDHLRAALTTMRRFGRVALCGAISQYNATGPVPGPDLLVAIANRLTLRGYIVTDHYDLFDEYVTQAAGWLRDGSLRSEETVVHGIEHAVDAFIGLLRGANTGKMLVRLAAE